MRRSSRRVAPAVAALLALVAVAAAEDDFPGAGRSDVARQARAAESPDDREEPDGPFILVLDNGDRITVTLVGLGAERLRFRPDATGDVDLAVPVAKIEGLERGPSAEPV